MTSENAVQEEVNEQDESLVIPEDEYQPNAFGLNFGREESELVLLPVPFDLTCSYRRGTATAAKRIIDASHQMDFSNPDLDDFVTAGVFCEKIPADIRAINDDFSARARAYTQAYDAGVDIALEPEFLKTQHDLNEASKIVYASTYARAEQCIEENKIIGLIGGEHSASLGVIDALSDYIDSFGVLQIDAHMDLRDGYQGLTHSHATVMRHVLAINDVSRLIQVGVRDYCNEELFFVEDQKGRVKTYFDRDIHDQLFSGKTWESICKKIVNNCPDKVYISCDIDGLSPSFCPNTGTPVPGGLTYNQVIFLIRQLVKAKKEIIGFDLVEVNGPEHSVDVITASHLLYQLCGYTWLSQEQQQ